MPYSVWISPHERFRDVMKEREQDAPTEALLDESLAEEFLEIQGAEKHDDGSWRLRYRSSDPHCCAWLWPSKGPLRQIELSASYGSPDFLRNAADMLDIAVGLAKGIGAYAYEEYTERRLSAAVVDELLSEKSHYTKLLVDEWQSVRKTINQGLYAPLEFPIGGADYVDEFFAFVIDVEGPLPTLERILHATPPHLAAHVTGTTAVLADRKSGQGVVRVLYDPEVRLVGVKPYWSRLPFRVLARHTLAALDAFTSHLRTRATYFGEAVTPAFRKEIEAHADGWGVDFFEWASERRGDA